MRYPSLTPRCGADDVRKVLQVGAGGASGRPRFAYGYGLLGLGWIHGPFVHVDLLATPSARRVTASSPTPVATYPTRSIGRVSTESATPVRLGLLGGFRLNVAAEDVTLPMNAQRLVCFLALQTQPLLRTFVGGALWGEATDLRAG